MSEVKSKRTPLIIRFGRSFFYYKLRGEEPSKFATCRRLEIMMVDGWYGFRGLVDTVELNFALQDEDVVPLEVELAGSWGHEHFAHMLNDHGIAREDGQLFFRCKVDQPFRIKPAYQGHLIYAARE